MLLKSSTESSKLDNNNKKRKNTMKNISFFIARRYSTGTPQERSLTTMARVCFWSILLGSFSLALVMAVMNGFEKATHEKIKGINADSTMRTFQGEFDLASLTPLLDNPSLGVAHWSPSAIGHALAGSTNELDLNSLILLKGIDPAREEQVSTIARMIIQPPDQHNKNILSTLIKNNHVLVGSTMARIQNLQSGDTLNLFVADQAHSAATKLALSKEKAVIAGIFQTGIDDFDANVVICDLPFLQTIDPSARIDTINLKYQPGINEKTVLNSLKKEFDDVDIRSWKELYPALVDALKLEKYAMFLILALIMLVACTNIIALLFMQITQKRGDIAILRSLGMSPQAIRRIFIFMGMGLSTVATLIGLTLATITSYLLDHFQLISLPDVYYVTHLPARMEPQLLLIVFAVIVLMSFGATWFATKKISSLNIAHILRFEA
jgi:lipoprotein-releasing system permease protein